MLMRQMNLEAIIQREVSRKTLYINTYIRIQKDGTDEPICRAAMETQTQGTDLWTQGGRQEGEGATNGDQHGTTD